MSDFGSALSAALDQWYRPAAGVKSGADTARGFAARLSALERHYGSKAAAAKAAGVGPSSWRAWTAKAGASSKRPVSSVNQAKVSLAYTAMLRDRSGTRGRGQRRAPQLLSVQAVVVAHEGKKEYKNSTPYRSFNAYDARGQLDGVAAVWRAGGSAAEVGKKAEDVIKEAYGTHFTFEDGGADGPVEVTLS